MGTGRTGAVVLAVVGLLALSSCAPGRSGAQRTSAPAPVAPSPATRAPTSTTMASTPVTQSPPSTVPGAASPRPAGAWASHFIVTTGTNQVTDLNPTAGTVYALADTPATARSDAHATPLRYDLATRRVLFGPSLDPGTMTVTGGWAWVAANDPGGAADVILYQLDLQDLAVVATHRFPAVYAGVPESIGPGATLTATVNGPLWLAGGSMLYALSPTTGTVLRQVPTDMAVFSLATAPDGTVLYAAGERLSFPLVLTDFDARTGRMIAGESEADSVAGGFVAAGDSGVWVSFRTGMDGVTVLHRKTSLGAVAPPDQDFPSPFHQGMGEQADVSDGALWLAGLEGLACADPTTGALRAAEPLTAGVADNQIDTVVARGGVLYGAGTGGLSVVDAPEVCFG